MHAKSFKIISSSKVGDPRYVSENTGICLIVLVSTHLFAAEKFTMFVEDNILYIDPPEAGGRKMKNVKILSYSVKYLGGKPFCEQKGKADIVISGPHLDGDQYDIEVSFTCPISDPKEGCKKWTWSKCAVDQTVPSEYPVAKCMTDSPPAVVSPECKWPSRSKGVRASQSGGGVR